MFHIDVCYSSNRMQFGMVYSTVHSYDGVLFFSVNQWTSNRSQ